jgi:hypothetical protein
MSGFQINGRNKQGASKDSNTAPNKEIERKRVMRIDFECSGGFANLRLSYHGHTDELPQVQAEEIKQLVIRSGYFDIQPGDLKPTGKGPPDVFHYTVSLSDGEKAKALACNDVSAPASLHPLLAKFRELALAQKTSGA